MPFLEIASEPMPLDNDSDSDGDSAQSVTAERSEVAEDHTEFTDAHYSGREAGGDSAEDLVSELSLEAGKTEERTREDEKPGKEECESSEDKLDYRGKIDTAL